MAEIGIILTKRTEKSIEGYYANSHVMPYVDDDGVMRIDTYIKKIPFCMDISNQKILTVGAGVPIEDAKKIGIKLKEVGYKNIVLKLNEITIPI